MRRACVPNTVHRTEGGTRIACTLPTCTSPSHFSVSPARWPERNSVPTTVQMPFPHRSPPLWLPAMNLVGTRSAVDAAQTFDSVGINFHFIFDPRHWHSAMDAAESGQRECTLHKVCTRNPDIGTSTGWTDGRPWTEQTTPSWWWMDGFDVLLLCLRRLRRLRYSLCNGLRWGLAPACGDGLKSCRDLLSPALALARSPAEKWRHIHPSVQSPVQSSAGSLTRGQMGSRHRIRRRGGGCCSAPPDPTTARDIPAVTSPRKSQSGCCGWPTPPCLPPQSEMSPMTLRIP